MVEDVADQGVAAAKRTEKPEFGHRSQGKSVYSLMAEYSDLLLDITDVRR